MKMAFKFMVFFTLLTGVMYPFLITGMGQLFFSAQSNGSLLRRGATLVGSELIAQKFTQEMYFWSRPSSNDWNTYPSGASNFAPTSLNLKELVNAQKNKFKDINVGQEMFFNSASGLDPHLSSLSIQGQIPRVIRARGLSLAQKEKLQRLVQEATDRPSLGFLGRERVNVLKLNLAMDQQL